MSATVVQVSGEAKTAVSRKRHMARESGYLAALAVVLGGVFVTWWILSAQLPPSFSSQAVGPARFPELVSGLGLCFSLLMLIGAVTGRGFRPSVTFHAPATTVSFLVLLPAYAGAMQWVGFYAASALALPLIMLLTDARRVVLLVAVPVLFCLFVYLCFGVALQVPIP